MKKLAFIFAFTLAGALEAQAAPTLIERFDDWGVYSFKSEGHTICYVLTKPKKAEPGNVDHGSNYFLIAPHADRTQGAYEPQARMGYPLKPNSLVNLQIGNDHFRMFTRDQSAWTRTLTREPELVKAIKGGQEMVLQAISVRGTNTRYSYSLKGVTAALKRAGKCK